MTLWYRVFGAGETEPAPGALLQQLNHHAVVTGRFSADQGGWFGAELVVAGSEPLEVERFLSTEDGVRAELNSWAAHLETCGEGPQYTLLMERMIQTKQMFTISDPTGAKSELCIVLCRCLAEVAEGVYQVDGGGFYSADGLLLIEDK
ncbi:MAG TPA: hypothetical protein DDY78_30150 [Planctomycetales bacterium]|jgi:hypothetical protein|nr:hypothetical protein [Planctomycetales bacterium]